MPTSDFTTLSTATSQASPAASVITIDQNHPAVAGRTKVSAGDSLKLDLAQLTSPNIQILLVDPTNHAVVLAQTPTLTDSIGLSVKIPDTTKTGDYNLQIQGVEKHEAITLPLTVQGSQTNLPVASTYSTPVIAGAFGLLLVIVVALMALRHKLSHK